MCIGGGKAVIYGQESQYGAAKFISFASQWSQTQKLVREHTQ